MSRKTRYKITIDDLDGQLKIQAQAPGVHIRGSDLSVVLVDYKNLRVREISGLVIDSDTPAKQLPEHPLRRPVYGGLIVIFRQDHYHVDATQTGRNHCPN